MLILSCECLTFAVIELLWQIGLSKEDQAVLMIVSSAIQYLCFFVGAYFLVTRYHRPPWQKMGFYRNREGSRPAGNGIITGVATYVFMIAASYVNLLFFPDGPQMQEVSALMMDETRPLVLFLMVICVAIFAPVCEELVFRGLLFTALKRRFGLWPGIILSALLFSLLHFSEYAFLPILACGIVFAYVYHRYGNLWVNIFAHATVNCISTLFILLV